MDFIKRMKRREYIEMGLKTAIGILLGIIVIFFMEAMIYGIYMNAIEDKSQNTRKEQTSVYYVDKLGDNKYNIYTKENVGDEKKPAIVWTYLHKEISQAKYDDLTKDAGVMFGYDATLYKVDVDMPNATPDEVYAVNSNSDSAYKQILAKENEDTETTYFEGATFTISFRETETSEYVKSEHENLTYNEFVALYSQAGDMVRYNNKIIYHAPNAFDIYLNGVHYAVMVIFLVVIAGVFVWRFVLINKEYAKIEKRYKKTGKVFKG